MAWLTLYAIVHIACGLITAGALYRHAQVEFAALKREKADFRMSMFLGLLVGPLGLFITWLEDGYRHGISLRRDR